MSGMQSTALQQAGVQFAGLQFASVGARLAQLRSGVSGISLSGLDLGIPGSAGSEELVALLKEVLGVHDLIGGGAGDAENPQSRLGFFVNGNLRRGSQDTTPNVTGFDFRSNGVTAGLDYRFTNHLIFGLAAGHVSGTTDFVDSSGRQDSRSNSGSLYGTYYNEAFYADLIGTYAHISYDAARTTSFLIIPGSPVTPSNCVSVDCSINTQGGTGAKQYSLAANTGYSFNRQAFVFGPDIAVNYTRINVNGFTESDPQVTGMGLSFDSQTGQSLLIKAGGHLSYAIKTSFAVILPEARIHYIHEFKNDQEAMTAHFSQDPTIGTPTGPVSNFVVFTDQPKRDYFDYAAGFSAQFAYGISAFVEYNALGGAGNVHAHEFAFGVRFQPVSR
jgi:outer membrane autotransporter protein